MTVGRPRTPTVELCPARPPGSTPRFSGFEKTALDAPSRMEYSRTLVGRASRPTGGKLPSMPAPRSNESDPRGWVCTGGRARGIPADHEALDRRHGSGRRASRTIWNARRGGRSAAEGAVCPIAPGKERVLRPPGTSPFRGLFLRARRPPGNRRVRDTQNGRGSARGEAAAARGQWPDRPGSVPEAPGAFR